MTPAALVTTAPRNAVGEQVLESLLDGLHLGVEIVSDARYCGSWYESERQAERGQFHLIGEGECVVEGAVLAQPVRLRGGDLVIFPHGTPHVLRSVGSDEPKPLCEGFTSMLCGEVDFGADRGSPLVTALPTCLIVQSADGDEGFRHLATLLLSSAQSRLPGQKVVMNKLAESLFTLAICRYSFAADNPRGVIAALAHPPLARVLAALHERPAADWTLERMAAIAVMSRSAFAAHFSEAMGLPPMHYLRQWRVAQARRLLHDRRLSVAAIAERLGYSSETAFRKLFKRLEGVGPGQARRGEAAGAVGEALGDDEV